MSNCKYYAMSQMNHTNQPKFAFDLPLAVIPPIYDIRVLPPVLKTSLSNASNNKVNF